MMDALFQLMNRAGEEHPGCRGSLRWILQRWGLINIWHGIFPIENGEVKSAARHVCNAFP